MNFGLPKVAGPLAGTSLPWKMSDKQRQNGQEVEYFCAALEDDGLMPRPFAVCKSGHCLCRLVLKPGEHLVQILWTESFEEPLSGC
jgi:hypothetical protein